MRKNAQKNEYTKQRKDIGQFFDLISSDVGIVEAFFLTPDNSNVTQYYDSSDKDQFLEDLLYYNANGYTCYAGIQPRGPKLLETTAASKKGDIVALRFLYLDIDPIRPKGESH